MNWDFILTWNWTGRHTPKINGWLVLVIKIELILSKIPSPTSAGSIRSSAPVVPLCRPTPVEPHCLLMQTQPLVVEFCADLPIPVVFSKARSLKLHKCSWSFLEWRKQSWLTKLGLLQQLVELICISVLQICSKCLRRGERNVKPWKWRVAQWPKNNPANLFSCPSTVKWSCCLEHQLLSSVSHLSVIYLLSDIFIMFCNHCCSTCQSGVWPELS